MKNILARSVQLLSSIAVGCIVSWVSLYAFFFGAWMFHSVTAARAADAIGSLLLLPGRMVFNWLLRSLMGGDDPTAIFQNPIAYPGTNGLILGIILYSIWRALLHLQTSRCNGTASSSHAANGQPVGQKVS